MNEFLNSSEMIISVSNKKIAMIEGKFDEINKEKITEIVEKSLEEAEKIKKAFLSIFQSLNINKNLEKQEPEKGEI
jgi:hypothetical protein